MTSEDNTCRLVTEQAAWLLDSIATSTQDRRFLRGDPECDVATVEAIRLNAEKMLRNVLDDRARRVEAWLTELARDLAITSDEYRSAVTSGIFVGRRIAPDAAKNFAHGFMERAEAVAGCAEPLMKEIRNG